ncbi:MAG: AAA family ATPase [Desulforhopalus sp.]
MHDSPAERQWLIESLLNPSLYDHPVSRFQVIETHISWVILTGDFVYKIKKPVNFGFLDFSTLEKRRFYCLEELRLNRRLAPHLYLGLVTISGSKEHLELNGPGAALEYAVKMVQFPQAAQLDRLPPGEGLDPALMGRLANRVAGFHLSVECAPVDSDLGEADQVRKTVMENFYHIRECTKNSEILLQLDELERWSKQQLDDLATVIDERKATGFVRECHGDMHLRNISLWQDEITIFDCIEFNKSLHFIDVISEIAFLIMDLEVRKQASLGTRFLNTYMQLTGDYEGLRLLKFYKVYRALVRAKVDILRTDQEQPGSDEYAETFEDFYHYLDLAKDYTRESSPWLIINHGVSGTGKSAGARSLSDIIPAIQVSSDVERKRLFGDVANIRGAGFEKGIYSPDVTRQIYLRLVEIADCLLTAGYSVIVDATNLKLEQRELFTRLSEDLGVRCLILSYTASVETLRHRVERRSIRGSDISDATVAILEYQLATCEPLSDKEKISTLEINTEDPFNVEKILRHLGKSS